MQVQTNPEKKTHLITKWIIFLFRNYFVKLILSRFCSEYFFLKMFFVVSSFQDIFLFFCESFFCCKKEPILFSFSRTQKTLDNSTTLEISTRSFTFGKSLQFIWVGIEVIYSDLGSSFFQTCLLYFWIKFSFNILPWLDRFFTT